MCFHTVLSFATHICDPEISSAFSIVKEKQKLPTTIPGRKSQLPNLISFILEVSPPGENSSNK